MKSIALSSFLLSVTAIAGMAGLLFGFDTGIIADSHWQITELFHLTDSQWAVVVSSTVFGAFLGSLFCGRVVDIYGCKNALRYTAVGFMLSTLIAAGAQGFITLVLGRLVIGFCIGITSFAAPLFISEIAPAKNRGMLVLFNSLAITGGESIAFFTGYYMQDVSPESWRLMFLAGIIPALILFVGLFFMPGSPRWLSRKYGLAAAKKALQQLRNSHEEVQAELTEIKLALNRQVAPATITSLFKKPIRTVLWIGVALGVLQHLCGINVIMYYGPFLFNQLGLPHSQALLATFIMGLTNMVFTLIALLLVDRVGRRKMLIVGSCITSVAMFVLAISGWFAEYKIIVSLICILIYIMAFALSLGCIFWLMIAELYPLEVRGLAMGFATSMQWSANFFVAISFLFVFNKLGIQFTLLIFSMFCAISAVFGIKYCPETSGVSLETIEQNLRRGLPARDLGITNV